MRGALLRYWVLAKYCIYQCLILFSLKALMFMKLYFFHLWYLSSFICIVNWIHYAFFCDQNGCDALKKNQFMTCISCCQYQCYLNNIFFGFVSVVQFVAQMSGVGGFVETVGLNLAGGKIFTASISTVDSLCRKVDIPHLGYHPHSWVWVLLIPGGHLGFWGVCKPLPVCPGT